ncbi:MAG: dephospho-CoA kinase [Planctomycetaceae bacterium]
MVFGESAEHKLALKKLEETVHPQIRTRIEETIRSLRKSVSCELIILDAALLLEAGWNEVCDLVFFIEVSEEIRMKRVIENRHWTVDEFRKRELNQLSLQEKQSRADYTIENNSDLLSAVDQLESCLKKHFQFNL